MKALLLCGGLGTRLGALCEDRPKPLLEIGDGSIVEHTLSRLGRHGFRDVFVNLHFRAEQFVARLHDGARYGCRIQYFHEATLLGTAGTARALHDLCEGEPLLVHYGDVLSEHDLTGLAERHHELRGSATIVVHERAQANSCALLGAGDRVEHFLERPLPEARAELGSGWAFSGICMLSPECLSATPGWPGADLPRDLFPDLARAGRLFAHRHAGYRCAIDSPARLASARQAWKDGTMLGNRRMEAT